MISVYLAAVSEVRGALGPAVTARLREEEDRVVVGVHTGLAASVRSALQAAFGATRVAAGDSSLAARTAGSFMEAKATMGLAESCTGGLIAKLLTDVPGSSAFLLGGVVAYSNEAKVRLLGVPGALIADHGAVSREVVEAMAQGARAALGAQYAAAVSGVAGPEGGTTEKPVGTVWLAAVGPDGVVESARFVFDGDRARIRALAAWRALLMLRALVEARREVA